MPDRRKHRGPHPSDKKLFCESMWPVLQTATKELGWLYERGYARTSSLKLVGDRHQLLERQRIAVQRSTCSDSQYAHRRARRLSIRQSPEVAIDGFNLLTTIEAALSGGVILAGRDGCFRDMASMHGSYRKVAETSRALIRIGRTMAVAGVQRAIWYLDRPVSNSGRLLTMIYEVAEEQGWDWQVEIVNDPDSVLTDSPKDGPVVVSADSEVIDGCHNWCNLAREIVESVDDAWIVPMAIDGDLHVEE